MLECSNRATNRASSKSVEAPAIPELALLRTTLSAWARYNHSHSQGNFKQERFMPSAEDVLCGLLPPFKYVVDNHDALAILARCNSPDPEPDCCAAFRRTSFIEALSIEKEKELLAKVEQAVGTEGIIQTYVENVKPRLDSSIT